MNSMELFARRAVMSSKAFDSGAFLGGGAVFLIWWLSELFSAEA